MTTHRLPPTASPAEGHAPTRRPVVVDRAMGGVVLANAVYAVGLGEHFNLLALSAWVSLAAVAAALLAVLLVPGGLLSRVVMTVALTVLVALQIHVAGGQEVYHFNVFVSLSMLLVWRDWRPIVLMAGLFAVHHLGFDRLLAAGIGTYCLSEPNLLRIVQHAAYVVVQSAVLSLVALWLRREADDAAELQRVVRGMVRDGKISLSPGGRGLRSEAGRQLAGVRDQMAVATGAMLGASQRVATTASVLHISSDELMTRTAATADGLKEASVCMDQIGVIVQESTEASDGAKSVSTNAVALAAQGDVNVRQLVKAMEDIQHASSRIEDIVGTIDSIAFQTNILALNAAVEAARAGDTGRGFAVVAAEVRMLAKRSAEAAQEIKGLVRSSSEAVSAGAALAAQTGQDMKSLVDSVKRVGDLFAVVTADTAAHMQGLRTVAQSIVALGVMTQQNVGAATRSAEAAAEMEAQSQALKQALLAFELGEEAGAGQMPAGQAAATAQALWSPPVGAARTSGPPTARPAGGPKPVSAAETDNIEYF